MVKGGLGFPEHDGLLLDHIYIYIINTISTSVCLTVPSQTPPETIGARDMKCWKMLENIPGVIFIYIWKL